MMISGSYTALVTPFDENGNINLGKMNELIDFQAENGTDGVVILGTTGESPTVSSEEAVSLFKTAVSSARGRLTVIAGCGSNDTKKAAEKCIAAADCGAEYALVITPYYNKTNTEGMIRHFSYIADKSPIPVIMYNVPSRTGCCIDINALCELSKHNNIVGIKEASGNMSYACEAARCISESFFMISGNDDITIPLMSVGACGVISVASNIIPGIIHRMTEAYLAGNTDEARRIQLFILPLIKGLFIETNPIPVKEAMNMLGFGVGDCRLPLFRLSEKSKSVLENEIKTHMIYGGEAYD